MEKLNAKIEKLSNKIRNDKSKKTNFLALDLQKLINKRDKLFHSLGY